MTVSTRVLGLGAGLPFSGRCRQRLNAKPSSTASKIWSRHGFGWSEGMKYRHDSGDGMGREKRRGRETERCVWVCGCDWIDRIKGKAKSSGNLANMLLLKGVGGAAVYMFYN